ncbi:MAG: hypothetical protein ACJLS3_03340 [Erythrobacter sp.]
MAETDQTKTSILRRGWGLLQWVVAVFALLLAGAIPLANQGLSVPGAPVTGLFISLAVFAALAICLSPPVFFRLPKKAKIGSYAGLFVAFFVAVNFNGMVLNSYKQTPEGAKWAAEREAEDAADRAEQAKVERIASEEQAAREGYEEAMARAKIVTAKLHACKRWGRIPALNSLVEERLHNPDSFEHVSTEVIIPTADSKNVIMKFRATNGFGGIITSEVLAHIDPDTCEIIEFSQPE